MKINFQRVILTRDKSYFSRENVLISRDTNFSWNFSRDNAICNTTWVVNYHVIQALISRDIDPDICIRSFSFIVEMHAEYKAASVSILPANLAFLMSISLEEKCV